MKRQSSFEVQNIPVWGGELVTVEFRLEDWEDGNERLMSLVECHLGESNAEFCEGDPAFDCFSESSVRFSLGLIQN